MALIFTVDDDPQISKLIKVLFEDRNHEVLAFNGGRKCLERLSENPSVVFLDMMMPHMNGIETLKLIKSINKDLPVIMLTGVNDASSVVQAMKLGAFDFITKPFDENRLFTTLDKALEQTTLAGHVRYLQDELNSQVG